MSNIILSKGIRNNLLSLQKTADLSATTQGRLATGKKVNSALDNPTNFFTAQSLTSRANDLNGLLDGISNAVKTIEAADKAITAITKLVESAQSIAKQASQDSSGAAQDNTTTAALGASKAAAAAVSLTATGGFTAGENFKIVSTDSTTGNVTSRLFAITSGKTVQSLVDDINASGVAVASISDDGKLSVKSTSSTTSLAISTRNAADSAAAAAATVIDGGDFTTTAASSSASSTRQALAKQFDEIRTQIDGLAKDAGFNGINLLNGDDLKVVFNEKAQGSGQNSMTVKGTAYTSTSLGIKSGTSGTGYANFIDNTNVDTALKDLTTALSTLRTQSTTLGSNLSVVQTRQDFTKDLSSTLQAGADNLVLADQNAEAANMLALQTRQSLSQSSMSLANQADQGVLRLLQ